MFPIQYKSHATETKGYLVGSVAMLLAFFIASPMLGLGQLVADKCIISEWNDLVNQFHAYTSKYAYSWPSQTIFQMGFLTKIDQRFSIMKLERIKG